jgi:hypothetical protein
MDSDQIGRDECTCPCHTSKRKIVHMMACCYNCPICDKHIKFENFQEHVKACQVKKSILFKT